MNPTPEGMRRITVEVPASLHAQFKSEVNRLGLDIRAVVMPLVKSWLSGETKIKIQPVGQSLETKIHPGDVGWEKSVEKLVHEILELHKREERETVEKPDEPIESVEIEEPLVLEETEEPIEAENPEDLKPKKKRIAGLWPWTKEVDVKEKPKEEKPKKKHGFWSWR